MSAASRHLLIAVVGILPCSTIAQQPFPTYADSGAWNTLLCLGDPPNACITQTFAYDGSDTFCGSTWSIYSWPTFGLDPGIAYLRNDGQRTLLRSSTNCSDKEYVIYDFSMAVGDTMYAPLNADLFTPDTAMFVLQDINTVNILGVERRRFSLLYDRCNTGMVNTPMEWIEGIGSTTHPFYSTDCLCDVCSQSFIVLCYDSSGVQVYQDPLLNTCDSTMIVGVPDHMPEEGPTFRVWQDPTNGTLLIQFDHRGAPAGAELSLLTADGRLAHRLNAPEPGDDQLTVQLQGIVGGVYLLQVSVRGERVAAERIVIQ